MKNYHQYLKELEELYYVAMTAPSEEVYHIIAIAKSEDEANKLVVDNTPFLVQTISLEPMNKRELNDWLDKMAEKESQKKISYKFFHGKNVDKKLTTM